MNTQKHLTFGGIKAFGEFKRHNFFVGEYRLKTLMHKLQVKPYRKLFQEM
jgi:hypothetical protein